MSEDESERLDLKTAKADARLLREQVPHLKKETMRKGNLSRQEIDLVADNDWLDLADERITELKRRNPEQYEIIMDEYDAKNELSESLGEEKTKKIVSEMNNTLREVFNEVREMNLDMDGYGIAGLSTARVKNSLDIPRDQVGNLFRLGVATVEIDSLVGKTVGE